MTSYLHRGVGILDRNLGLEWGFESSSCAFSRRCKSRERLHFSSLCSIAELCVLVFKRAGLHGAPFSFAINILVAPQQGRSASGGARNLKFPLTELLDPLSAEVGRGGRWGFSPPFGELGQDWWKRKPGATQRLSRVRRMTLLSASARGYLDNTILVSRFGVYLTTSSFGSKQRKVLNPKRFLGSLKTGCESVQSSVR